MDEDNDKRVPKTLSMSNNEWAVVKMLAKIKRLTTSGYIQELVKLDARKNKVNYE